MKKIILGFIVALFSAQLIAAPMSSRNAKTLIVSVTLRLKANPTFDSNTRDWTADSYETVVQAAIAPSAFQSRKGYDPASGALRHFDWVTQQFGASPFSQAAAAELFRAPTPYHMNAAIEEYRLAKAYTSYSEDKANAEEESLTRWQKILGGRKPWAPTQIFNSFKASSEIQGFWDLMYGHSGGDSLSSADPLFEYAKQLGNTERSYASYAFGRHMNYSGGAYRLVTDVLNYIRKNGIESAWIDMDQDIVINRRKAYAGNAIFPAQTQYAGDIYRVSASWMLTKDTPISTPAQMRNQNNVFLGSWASPVYGSDKDSQNNDQNVIEVFYINSKLGQLSDLRNSWQKVNPGAQGVDPVDVSVNGTDLVTGQPVDNSHFMTRYPANFSPEFARLLSSLNLSVLPGSYPDDSVRGRLFVLVYDKNKQPRDVTDMANSLWIRPMGAKNNVLMMNLDENSYQAVTLYDEIKKGLYWQGGYNWSVASNIPTYGELVNPRDQEGGARNQAATFAVYNGPMLKLQNQSVPYRGKGGYSGTAQGVRTIECLLNAKISTACKYNTVDIRSIMEQMHATQSYVHYVGRWEILPDSTNSGVAPQMDIRANNARYDILKRKMAYNLCQAPYYDSVAKASFTMVRPIYRYRVNYVNDGYQEAPGRYLDAAMVDSSIPVFDSALNARSVSFSEYGVISSEGSPYGVALGGISYFKRWKVQRDSDFEKMILGNTVNYTDGGSVSNGMLFVDPTAGSDEYDRTTAAMESGNLFDQNRVDMARAFVTDKSSRVAGQLGTVAALDKVFRYPTLPTPTVQSSERKQIIFGCEEMNDTMNLSSYQQADQTGVVLATVTNSPVSTPASLGGYTPGTPLEVLDVGGFVYTDTGTVVGTVEGDPKGSPADGGSWSGVGSGFPSAVNKSLTNASMGGDSRYGVGQPLYACVLKHSKKQCVVGPITCEANPAPATDYTCTVAKSCTDIAGSEVKVQVNSECEETCDGTTNKLCTNRADFWPVTNQPYHHAPECVWNPGLNRCDPNN